MHWVDGITSPLKLRWPKEEMVEISRENLSLLDAKARYWEEKSQLEVEKNTILTEELGDAKMKINCLTKVLKDCCVLI